MMIEEFKSSTTLISFSCQPSGSKQKTVNLISNKKIKSASLVQQPFKHHPNRSTSREIPSPSKELVATMDGKVTRIRSAVIRRHNKRLSHGNHANGWLLKARLRPLKVSTEPERPSIQECKGIVGCCRKSGKISHNRNQRLTQVTQPKLNKYDWLRAHTYATPDFTRNNSSPKIVEEKAEEKEIPVIKSGCTTNPIKMISVRRSPIPRRKMVVSYKSFSGQFCGRYNVPGLIKDEAKLESNVLVPRYGSFNSEECFAFEHNSKIISASAPASASTSKESFSVELDKLLDRFDSDEEIVCQVNTDEDIIANKYYNTREAALGWDQMIDKIACGAIDISGSKRSKSISHKPRIASSQHRNVEREDKGVCVLPELFH